MSHLPKGLWEEVLMYAVWLKDQMSTKGLEQGTPYKALTGNKPDLAHLNEWVQKVWVHYGASSKLDGQAKEAHWIGSNSETKGHCIFWPNRPRVSVECKVKFKHDHILMTEPPMPVSLSPPVSPHLELSRMEQLHDPQTH